MPRAKSKPPKVPEADVLKAVLDCLRIWGLEPRRKNTGAALNPRGQMVRFGQPGDPDVETTLPGGRLCQIEVKAPGKRPKPEQFDRLRLCNEQGGVGLWVDDAGELARILPKLCAGAKVEIDETGQQWLITEEEDTES
jgi:hypothetical protein